MAVAFPDLPKGGSLDDVPDAGAAIQQMMDAMNANPPALNKKLGLYEEQGTGLLFMRDEISGPVLYAGGRPEKQHRQSGRPAP